MNIVNLTLFKKIKKYEYEELFNIGLVINNNDFETEIAESSFAVCSDCAYKFKIDCEQLCAVSDIKVKEIEDIHVFINNVEVEHEKCRWNKKGEICFTKDNTSRLFIDCFGYVRITLVLELSNETELRLYSQYLPVLVRVVDEENNTIVLNEAVKEMAAYVYKNNNLFLFNNGNMKSKDMANLDPSGRTTFLSYIKLTERVIKAYDSCYGYFRNNSKFCAKKFLRIEPFEHLQYVTPSTLEYIANHPEQLKLTNSNKGISFGENKYYPQKILTLKNMISYDIYENRVILSFLKKLLVDISNTTERVNKHIEELRKRNGDNYKVIERDYVFSPAFIYEETKLSLEESKQKLQDCLNEIKRLSYNYHHVFNIDTELLKAEPHMTPIFKTVPQYNIIFMKIYEWFNYGVYNFEQEEFMFSIITISNLYESYLLSKMISYFKNRQYVLSDDTNSEHLHKYPVSDSRYEDTKFSNTFQFQKHRDKVTLYYQPVVFNSISKKYGDNNIGLYRNNSIPVYDEIKDEGDNSKRSGGAFYQPDFLIKIERDKISKYLIIDAKFSKVDNVRNFYIKDLAFKYLFSLSPIHDTDYIVGLCAIYGKCMVHEKVNSVFEPVDNHEIFPFVDMIPMLEGVNTENHNKIFDELMKKAMSYLPSK